MAGAQRVKVEATKREVLEAQQNEEERERCDDVSRVDEIAAPSSGASHDAEEEGNLNAYELERERNIARNRARMEAVVGESKRGLAATKRAAAAATKASAGPRRRPRPPPPSAPTDGGRGMPTRASRRLGRTGDRPPSPLDLDLDRSRTANGTPPDCRAVSSRSSARPVVPACFVRGVPSNAGVADDAEALRRLNSFRTSYMSRAALFNRVMAVSNALKLEDFAAVLEEEAGGEEDRRDLAALAREKLALMKKGDPAAVRDFVLRSKEREYERREREAAEAEEEEEGEEGGE